MGCDSDSVIGPRRTIKTAYIDEYPWHLIKRDCNICASYSKKSNYILQCFYLINGTWGSEHLVKYTRLCTLLDDKAPPLHWLAPELFRWRVEGELIQAVSCSSAAAQPFDRSQEGTASLSAETHETEWLFSDVGEGRERGRERGRTDLLLSHALTFSGPSTDNNNLTATPPSASPTSYALLTSPS